MKYILTGGGTGGHVYPALAIKEIIELNDPDPEFLYVGVKGKAEESIVGPIEDLPIEFVHAEGFPRSLSPGRLFSFLKTLITGYREALQILKRFKPDIIIATGGYVTAPVLLAGRLRGVRSVIHEQNSVPGLVNRTAGKLADRIMITFAETATHFNSSKTVVTGYPNRKKISNINKSKAREALGIPADSRTVFIFGGSSGARSINETVVQHLDALFTNKNIFVIHGTGKDRPDLYNAYSDTIRIYSETHAEEIDESRYMIRDYFENIDQVYAASDLIVCRAGAGALMECASQGKPMIVLPKKKLPGNHQEKNAEAAERTGGAIVIKEEIFENQVILDGEKLVQAINSSLFDESRLAEMSKKIRNLYTEETPNIISSEIRELILRQQR